VLYGDDLIQGVFRLTRSDERRPVNVGNLVEHTVREIAELVIELSDAESGIVYEPFPEDDLKRRCPDIGRAREDWAGSRTWGRVRGQRRPPSGSLDARAGPKPPSPGDAPDYSFRICCCAGGDQRRRRPRV
jgi:hypothetical protein